MRFHRIILGLTAAVLLAQTAPAQVAPGRGAQRGQGVAAVRNFLSLTDQQVQQLLQLSRQEQEALQPLREQIREKTQALNAARKAATPNPGAIGQLVIDLQNLREQVRTSNEGFRTKAVALLDAGQQEKLTRLQQAATMAARTRQAVNGATALNLLLPPLPARAGGRGTPQP